MMPVRFIHVVPRRRITDDETTNRCRRAWDSWSWMYEVGGVTPAHCWSVKRDARSIGDTRDLPFLKDVLSFGMEHCDSNNDIILFSNDDVVLHPMLLGEAKRHVALYGCGACRRVDIDIRGGKTVMPPLWSNPTEFLDIGFPHLGRDAFVFTRGWLKARMSLIPDFLLGAWGWDICLAAFMRLLKGVEVVMLQSLYDCVTGCDLPDGLVIHEAHNSKWMEGKDWESKPANAHNRKLFDAWHKQYCPVLTLERVGQQEYSKAATIRHARFWTWRGWTLEDTLKNLRHEF